MAMFSTFVGFEDNRFQRWLTEPALRRNLQRQNVDADGAEADRAAQEFWVLYWHRLWGNGAQPTDQQFALGHLSAYLQEACYGVAQRMASQLKGVQYGVADCFQIAIAAVPTLLKGYSPTQGASLATYAGLCFGNTIRDVLRQQREVNSRSDWGLLRKASQKQITEALLSSGLGADRVGAYRRLWMAYKACWAGQTAATRQLSAPDAKTWQAIADLYHQQVDHQQVASDSSENPVTAATAEQWLKETARALRQWLQPTVVSLNVPRFEDGSEWQDALPADGNSPWTELLTQEEMREREQQRLQLGQRLQAAVADLAPQDRQLLALYYCQGSTQQQIAEQLQIKQYTVSRRLSRVKETLLLALATESQEKLHIALTSPVLKQMSLVLEEWLQHHLTQNATQDRLLKA